MMQALKETLGQRPRGNPEPEQCRYCGVLVGKVEMDLGWGKFYRPEDHRCLSEQEYAAKQTEKRMAIRAARLDSRKPRDIAAARATAGIPDRIGGWEVTCGLSGLLTQFGPSPLQAHLAELLSAIISRKSDTDLKALRGVWAHGPTGSGKSTCLAAFLLDVASAGDLPEGSCYYVSWQRFVDAFRSQGDDQSRHLWLSMKRRIEDATVLALDDIGVSPWNSEGFIRELEILSDGLYSKDRLVLIASNETPHEVAQLITRYRGQSGASGQSGPRIMRRLLSQADPMPVSPTA